MPLFGMINYIDTTAIAIGCAAIIALASGSWLSQFVSKQVRRTGVPSRRRVHIVVVALLVLSIAMHLILMNGLFTNTTTLIEILQRQPGAIFRFRNDAGRIPGITSFTQVYVLVFTILGAYRYWYGRWWTTDVWLLLFALLGLMFLRAFTLAERLILIEAVIFFALPFLMFSRVRNGIITFLPVFGLFGIFALFAAGEYFRSWTFYQDSYDSFLEFISLRLSGYVITATNTGAGILERIGTTGFPYVTALWFWRLPGIESLFPGVNSPVGMFLRNYGNPEFNNPSGIFAGIIDYGIYVGLLMYLALGIVAGVLYRQFRAGNVIGVLIYPVVFMGLLELTQLFYLGDQRLFTTYALLIPILIYLRPQKQPAKRYILRRVAQQPDDGMIQPGSVRATT